MLNLCCHAGACHFRRWSIIRMFVDFSVHKRLSRTSRQASGRYSRLYVGQTATTNFGIPAVSMRHDTVHKQKGNTTGMPSCKSVCIAGVVRLTLPEITTCPRWIIGISLIISFSFATRIRSPVFLIAHPGSSTYKHIIDMPSAGLMRFGRSSNSWR